MGRERREIDFITKAMDPNPQPWCVKFCIDKGLDFGPTHEYANIVLCSGLIAIIAYKPRFKEAYKTNLLPLLIVQLVLSFSNALIHSVPFAFCYFPKTWYLAITGLVSQIAYTFKPFFILHSLIRVPLVERYSYPGLIGSVLIPTCLSVIPIADYVLDMQLFSDQLVAGSITCGCGLVNLGISIYLIWSRQTGGSSFPLFMVVYEVLFSIPESIKLALILRFDAIEAYATMETLDDYAFYFTVLICSIVLFWQNRRQPRLANGKIEWDSFENQNVYV
ncbi:hypothetical protein PRIPAC_74420 [Pristionchus pacificus]|uniref:Uncharacterized protein n=1 Tax=Pristionchus pacificus TaxID=54126 RepID=A0A2A6C5F3_PRIPA|nr:hypothetical protein PRIPAC_74420 [Pristionchus pacificus]|eukprot:PDM73394.1 hypothetical protein PRIPAC_40750 [Pristionchus pacificus]